jgi:hypothetical protein
MPWQVERAMVGVEYHFCRHIKNLIKSFHIFDISSVYITITFSKYEQSEKISPYRVEKQDSMKPMGTMGYEEFTPSRVFLSTKVSLRAYSNQFSFVSAKANTFPKIRA